MKELTALIEPLKEIARSASREILAVYERPGAFDVQTKSDMSPVTEADLAAHRVILAGLQSLTPEVPIVSEESTVADYAVRKEWPRYWLVDPLDGTKEFLNRNGEFTVNIALIEGGRPVLGVVMVPPQDLIYSGIVGVGAFRQSGRQAAEPIHPARYSPSAPLRVVASRRHGAEALEKLLEGVKDAFNGLERVSMGSSLKICVLAEGKADWYPRFGPTCEWDTAAAQAILEAAGGKVVNTAFQPLQYNKESLLNSYFHALADSDFDWEPLISQPSQVQDSPAEIQR